MMIIYKFCYSNTTPNNGVLLTLDTYLGDTLSLPAVPIYSIYAFRAQRDGYGGNGGTVVAIVPNITGVPACVFVSNLDAATPLHEDWEDPG
jgi:hypothetical protein